MSIRPVLAALAAPLLLTCTACGGPEAADPAKNQAQRDERDYLRPPSILTARIERDGAFAIEGVAQPGARVVLTGAEGGGAQAQADGEGHWSVRLPAAAAVRLFGITMTASGRTVEGEGFLMLAPDGRAAQLRAGSASRVLTAATRAPRILAVDFDRDGGAIIGGVAQAGSGMNIRVDRTAAGDVTADSEGRFVAAILRRLPAGSHLIDVSGDAGGDELVVRIEAAAPLGGAVFRAQRLDRAWRVDWRTPGGGVQSSVVVARTETGA